MKKFSGLFILLLMFLFTAADKPAHEAVYGPYKFIVSTYEIKKNFPPVLDVTAFFNGEKLNPIIKDGEYFDITSIFAAKFNWWEENIQLIIFTTGQGSGAYGKVFAFDFNQNQWREILFPQLDGADARGYMGHDAFSMEKQMTSYLLVRRFPLYKEKDANCCPTGGYRIIKYAYDPAGIPRFKAVKTVDRKK